MIELTQEEVVAIQRALGGCQYSYPALDSAFDKVHPWYGDAVILTRKEYERLRNEAAAHSLRRG